jgi:hypothetical protein
MLSSILSEGFNYDELVHYRLDDLVDCRLIYSQSRAIRSRSNKKLRLDFFFFEETQPARKSASYSE